MIVWQASAACWNRVAGIDVHSTSTSPRPSYSIFFNSAPIPISPFFSQIFHTSLMFPAFSLFSLPIPPPKPLFRHTAAKRFAEIDEFF